MTRRSIAYRLSAGSAMVIGVALSPNARAETPKGGANDTGSAPLSGAEVSIAETLYREGRKLMAQQRYAEACAKFAESHRLDPATGTLLNLATCHEAQGKLASAWLAFSEAARAARREQREDRVRFAEEHIRGLEPKLSRLTIEVPKTPEMEEAAVRVDGFVIGAAAYGLAAPIDPGTHRVEASAPGRKKWSAEVVVGGNADQQVVTVPALEPEPVVPAAPAAAREPAPPSAAIPPPPAETREPASRPVPAAVFVIGGATVLLAGAAIITGLTYVDRRSDYSTIRDDPTASPREKQDARDDAKTFGWMNVGFSAGALVGAGVTVLLYSTRPERPRTGSAVPRLSAWVLPKEGGLALTSEF